MNNMVSYLSEAGTKVSGSQYVERVTSVAGRLVSYDADDPGIPKWHSTPPRGTREEIPVIADEPQGIHESQLPHSRTPPPFPGLAAGKPEISKYIAPAQTKLAEIKKAMAADRAKWLERQEKERKNEERAGEYRELQKQGGRHKRQDIGPDEDEEWSTQDLRGVPNSLLHHPPKVVVPTEARPGKYTGYARRGRNVNTFRPEQGLDITAVNAQIQRGDMPIIGNSK